MRRIRSPYCARAASGHAAAAPPKSVMKSRRLISAPVLRKSIVSAEPSTLKGVSDSVRYGVFAARIMSAWIAS